MSQFENVDFEEMKQSREKLHDLFHLFMKASKESMQDNDKKEQLPLFFFCTSFYEPITTTFYLSTITLTL